jgi:hypothetical protein
MSHDREMLSKLEALQSKVNALEKREYLRSGLPANFTSLTVDGDIVAGGHFYSGADLVPSSWGEAVGAYLTLSGLRGFWPMSSLDAAAVYDHSGAGRNLSGSGSPTFNQAVSVGGLVPYVVLNTNNYLYRADEAALDILGTETYMATLARGLTVGAWVRPEAAPGSQVGIIGKWNAAGSRSYLIYTDANLKPIGAMSVDGTAATNVTATNAMTVQAFNFVAYRFDPSTSVDLFVNGVKTSNTTSIPAAIFNSNARFEIGSFANGTSSTTWAHEQALCFLCAAALSDDVINALYQVSKGIFGV